MDTEHAKAIRRCERMLNDILRRKTALDAELERATETLRTASAVADGCSRLKALRKRANVTQHWIAETLGVPPAYVSWVERGYTYGIGAEALARILDFYRGLADGDDAGRRAEVREESRVQDVEGSGS